MDVAMFIWSFYLCACFDMNVTINCVNYDPKNIYKWFTVILNKYVILYSMGFYLIYTYKFMSSPVKQFTFDK